MNIYSNTNSPFPSQVVSDAEKASLEYGMQVAQAIEQEWFSQGRTSGNRSEEHTSELQSRLHLVCRLLLEKKKEKN